MRDDVFVCVSECFVCLCVWVMVSKWCICTFGKMLSVCVCCLCQTLLLIDNPAGFK